MKYISVDALQAFCDNQKDHSITSNDFQRMNYIEVVHCPDCLYQKNCISTENGIEQDGFCKWGKRKDGDGDG